MSRKRKSSADPSQEQADAGPVAPLRYIRRVDSIRDGAEDVIEPTQAELAEIAALQDLQALENFRFAYTLQHAPGEAVRLKARLKARPTQTCVVTLQPVVTDMDLPVEATFWPTTMIDRWQRETDEDALAEATAEWPEPIRNGEIDLGPLIYESFAMALDPYPRVEGAELDLPPDEPQSDAGGTGQNPFAALERLKQR